MSKHVDFWLAAPGALVSWLLQDLLGTRRGLAAAIRLQVWMLRFRKRLRGLFPWRLVRRDGGMTVFSYAKHGEKWERHEFTMNVSIE